jgi:uncharacterized protein YecE (DUF72 family)
MAELRVGTAGWNVSQGCKGRVGGAGSHLERYARVLNATEINSSFHRLHRRSTYEKWARATPDDFRFSVKVPKSVTHSSQLARYELDRFIEECAGLGAKLGVLLVQFAPRKIFVESDAKVLFGALQQKTSAALACEPRHASCSRQRSVPGFGSAGLAASLPILRECPMPPCPAAGRACAIFGCTERPASTTPPTTRHSFAR